MIPEETVREIRERVTILDVVSDYVSLKKSGANYQGLCPFHGEKTPSFNVNPGRGIFHCFGCGAGGNVFSFVMRMEGVTFPEALKLMAKRGGVTIDERPLSPTEKVRRDEKEELFSIADLACQFYRSLLFSGEEGESCRKYLEKRGVDRETAEAYRLGFAPERWDTLCRYLERRKVSLVKAEKLGLIRQRENGGYYDTFRNRLLFTITDLHGRPVAFGGRVLDDSLPKYINSPESPIYHKGELLFGLDLAKQAIREKGSAILVEGYFDHLSLYQTGVREVVATCGTALTTDQIKLLHRYAGRIYTLFDADAAGQKATIRAMDMVLPEGISAAVIELPAGDDPDSFVKREGVDGFRERVEKARPILEYFYRKLQESDQAGTIEGKTRLLEELVPRIRLIDDRIQRKLYVTEIARVLDIDEAELRDRTGLSRNERSGKRLTPVRQQRHTSGSAEMLVLLMATYPELALRGEELNVSQLLPAHYQVIVEAIITESRNRGQVDLATLLENSFIPDTCQQLSSFFVNDAHLEGMDPQKAFDDCCRSMEKQLLRQSDAKALRQELDRLDSESPRYWEILKTLDTLRNKKSQLS